MFLAVNHRIKLVLVFIAVIGLLIWLFLPNNKARVAAEKTRQALRADGFKVDLEEFDLSMPSALVANNETLMSTVDASRNMFSLRRLDLMRPMTSNSAMVTWKQENPAIDFIDDHFWSDLRKTLNESDGALDRACQAIIAAPFRFKTVLATNGELAPDVLRARLLGATLAGRTIVELHDRHQPQAWTNWLALTRLVTAWQTEPVEISHLIRFRWVSTAQRVTWEALQANDWSEAQLATLQREWESPNFFAGLPETAALARASTVEFCNFQRRQPPAPGPTLREFISELINSPNHAWADATVGWRSARYRNYESYEDERTWLLYFRDCETDYRRALGANSWLELRHLPSATNSRPVGASGALVRDASRMGPAGGPFQRQGQTLLARAAEAEARRRLLVTAIAIERYHLANDSYPDSLSKLEPKFLRTCPKDFMDGETLRYRRVDHARFLLYSVGADGIDDGGKLPVDIGSYPVFGRAEGPDLVWPLPASADEVRDYAQAAETKRAGGSMRGLIRTKR